MPAGIRQCCQQGSVPSALMWLHLGCTLHSKYIQAQHKASKLMKGLEHLSHEQRLRELGMSNLITKRVRRILPILPVCRTTWWEGRKAEKKRKSLFSSVPTGMTRSRNRNKWKYICKNTCSLWAEEKVFLLWGWSNTEKSAKNLGLSVWFNRSVTADMFEDGWNGSAC